MKSIIVLVAANGQARVEAQGFEGADCRQATEFIRQALGASTQEQLTAEFYTQPLCQSAHAEQHL